GGGGRGFEAVDVLPGTERERAVGVLAPGILRDGSHYGTERLSSDRADDVDACGDAHVVAHRSGWPRRGRRRGRPPARGSEPEPRHDHPEPVAHGGAGLLPISERKGALELFAGHRERSTGSVPGSRRAA